jgi:hypothetical protein
MADIKRVRFFDGQFLKEGDFQAEQRFHLHLRRRMNFVLFQQSGVLPITPTDLTLEVVNAADKTFRIKAGTAIAQNQKEQEGREIILSEDSAPIDLDASGIGAGQTAVVCLHWEEITSDLSTEGEVSQDTRFFEQAVIHVGLVKPATPVSTGDPYVQLGTVRYDDMDIAPVGREIALVRSALIATVPGPIITGVTGTISAATGPVTMTIQGSNLGSATQVTFSDPLVTATLGANTATTLAVTVNIAAGATPGAKSFQVSTSAGTGFSPGGVVFTVLQPPPTITGMVGTPTVVVGGPPVTMTINGTNLTGAIPSFPLPAGANISVLPGVIAASGSVTFQVQATAGATAGLKAVRVDTPGGTATSGGAIGLTVVLPPTITGLSGVTSVVANGVATPGVIINGTNLVGAGVTFPGEPQMNAVPTAVNAAGTQLTVTVTAGLAVTAGPKSYTVSTAAGSDTSDPAERLTVTAPLPLATITSIVPASGSRGTTVNATINGTNLAGATAVAFSGTGITAVPGAVNAAGTQLAVAITMTITAPFGNRTFTVTTPAGSSPSGAVVFNVTP